MITNVRIAGRKIVAQAISRKWPGAIVACKYDKKAGNTLIEWTDGVVKAKAAAEIIAAQNEYDVLPPTDLAAKEIMSPAVQAILSAVLERQEAKGAPVTLADKDAINARAIEIRKDVR